MRNWKTVLKADPTDWLLGEDNPSVRYLTLVDLLGKPAENREVARARKKIMESGAVPRILEKQEESGSWERPDRFYTAKYRGTVWQLIILAEHFADPDHERIKKAGNLLLDYSQNIESGGFSMHQAARTGGGRAGEVIPCLTGNMVWSLIRLGFLKDPRIQRGIGWITRYQRFDDGSDPPPREKPYEKFEMCWGRHSCHMGVIKALKALAEIPPTERTDEVRATISRGVEYFLLHHVYKQSHNLKKVSKPGWTRFGFPMMYQTDVLEILGILTRLGCKDERMREAVDLVIDKQDESGKWKMGNNFNGSFQVDIEEKGKPSKWITLNALRILKGFFA